MSVPVCTYEEFLEMVKEYAIKCYGEKNKQLALEGVNEYLSVVRQRYSAFANNPVISLEGAKSFAKGSAETIWEFY